MTTAMLCFLATWAKRMSWSDVDKAFGVIWDYVSKAVTWVVEYGLLHQDLSGITAIGVDEIAHKKGHKFITLAYQIDAGRRRLLWIGEGHTQATLESFFTWFGKERATALELVESGQRATIGAFVAVVLAVRAACVLLLPIGTEADMLNRRGDKRYYFQIARGILKQAEFVEGNLRAYRPPLYPALLAVHLAIFGSNTLALVILQNVAFVAAIALLVVIATRLHGLRVAITCGALVLMSPEWIKLPQMAYSETPFLLLVIGALLLALDLAERPSAARALVCGLLLGPPRSHARSRSARRRSRSTSSDCCGSRSRAGRWR